MSGRCCRFLSLLLVVSAALQFSPSVGAQEAPPTGDTDRSLGLALAGGGALGFAHLGVLLVLEEYGISPEIVVGTSMGSIVGALYSVGYTPQEILAIVESVDWSSIFTDTVSRRELAFEQRRSSRLYRASLAFEDGELLLLGGASAAQSIMEFLGDLTRSAAVVEDFSTFPRDLSIVAADLVSGDEVVFTGGDLVSAVRASMAVPGAFTPLFFQDRFLIDGGWVNNIPVDVARDRGAEAVIAVNLSLMDREAEDLRDIPTILNQASRILRQQRIEENLARADVIVTPDVAGYTPADFGRWRELVELGRRAAREQLPALLALGDTVRAPVIPQNVQPEQDVSVDVRSVRISAPDFLALPEAETVRRELSSALVGSTSVRAIQETVYGLYDTGLYRQVFFDLVPTHDGGRDLVVYLTPTERSATLLRIGFGVRTQLVENRFVRAVLHADYRRPLGADRRDPNQEQALPPPELRLETWIADVLSLRVGLGLPVAGTLRVRTRAYTLAKPLSFYDDGTLEALYFRRNAGGDLGAVWMPGQQWRVEAGGFGEAVWTQRQQGTRLLQDSETIGRLGTFIEGRHDNLDRGIFPRRGTETRVAGRLWWDPPAPEPFITAAVNHRSYLSLGRNVTLLFHLTGGSDLDTGIAVEDQFYGGGVERGAGFYFGELRGRHLVGAGLGARIAAFDLPFALGERAYITTGVGATQVWSGAFADALDPERADIPRLGATVGLAFNTAAGEFSIGFSVNDSLRPVSYIVLGPVATPTGDIWNW